MKSNPDQPDYTPYINRLLRLANATDDHRARTALARSLERAQAIIDQARIERERVPPGLFEQLRNHLRQTVALLERLEEYQSWKDVSFEDYAAGNGIAVAITTREFDINVAHKQPQSFPADGSLVTINVKEALRNVKYKISCRRRVAHGQPKKTDKSGSVFYAKNFFGHYSPYPLRATPKGKFTEFCALFYRAAGGGAIRPGELSWHIRKALKEKRVPMVAELVKFEGPPRRTLGD
jgi:hypothetical protein